MKNQTSYDIVRKPIITEKSMEAMANKKYTFLVNPKSNKSQIKRAVEEIFGVDVKSVATMRAEGKLKRMGMHLGRRSSSKKAIVTLTEDSKSIEFFEEI